MSSAIRGAKGTLLVKVLVELIREVRKMGLNFDRVEGGVAKLQNDLGNVAKLVKELRDSATNPADQAKLDAIATALESIDTGLDAIAPDAVTTDEPPAPGAPVG